MKQDPTRVEEYSTNLISLNGVVILFNFVRQCFCMLFEQYNCVSARLLWFWIMMYF